MTESVRRASPGDIDALVALARVVWSATYAPLISPAQIEFMLAGRYSPARIRAQLDDPDHAWWVAGSGALCGFAHASQNGQVCKLDKLYVHPDQQRRGLGAALFDGVRDWARERHATRLWLQVNRGNTQALRAYEQWGFRVVESRMFDIGGGFVMDDYVMEITP